MAQERVRQIQPFTSAADAAAWPGRTAGDPLAE
jgi:hypothetical protein